MHSLKPHQRHTAQGQREEEKDGGLGGRGGEQGQKQARLPEGALGAMSASDEVPCF